MSKLFSFFLILFILNLCQARNEKRNLMAEGELSDDIIIIHTNDVHCAADENIGYDGLMLYKKELEKKYKNVITVDVGDHVQGGNIGILSKGLDIIDIMNEIKYDVAVLGNHEFDYGLEQLDILSKKINCGYISANYCYRKNKTSIYKPYKIIEKGDKKIGFIGVTTPQTLSKSYMHNIVDENKTMIYDFLTERDGHELYETIQGYINEVREKGANYVIILAHLGNEGDASEKYTSNSLLANINGVDAVLDGHSHRNYSLTSKDKDGKDIYVVQTGTKLNYIGAIKLSIDGSVTSKLISEVPEPEDKEGAQKITRGDKERWIDANMAKMIEEKIKSHSDQLNEIIGYTDFDLLINMDKSSDSRKQISRSEESTLCDLVSDAIRYIGKGDINMINAGSIRSDLFKGNITYKNILDILPFSADIVVKKILGQDILDALEYGMRLLPEKTSIFPQVSGINFKVNTGIKSSVEVDSLEMFVRVAGERRVSDVYVGDEKLDLEKNYTLSFDKYISDGGDGYSMFTKYEEISVTSNVDNQAFKIYIKDVLNGTIPDRYKHKQGRINIVHLEPEVLEGGSSALVIILVLLLCLIIIGVIAFFIYRIKKRNEVNNKINIDGDIKV